MVTSSWCNTTARVNGSVECLRLPTCLIAETVAMMSPEQRLCGAACGPTRDLSCYALTSAGFQMLILRVSGIRKRASTKHTAGTAIG
jgi:hypothetical protein